MTPDLEFARGQQEEIGAALRTGDPDQFGLRMAASDWVMEEVILSRDLTYPGCRLPDRTLCQAQRIQSTGKD